MALQSALIQLIEAVGSRTESDVRVATMNLGNEMLYAALVPIECRAEVFHYLAEHTDLRMPLDGGALTLRSEQVLMIIGLAHGTKQNAALGHRPLH